MTKLTAALLAGAALAATIMPGAMAQETTGAPAQASTGAAARPWMDQRLSPDQRTDRLLAAMTLDEKVALLHGPMAMPFGPFKLPEGAIGSAGYIPGNARLGIPALNESDASLGVTNPMLVRGANDMATPLPSGQMLAATFNPQIAFQGGAVVGGEARAKGINVQLAGGVNLARDPRNGRNFEYVGEDPLLAGTMAGEAIRGIQSAGTISTVKHYTTNDQEHKRMTADSVIGEAAHRESDLLAFQIAIEKGKPGSVMCAYNMINGTYGCENDHLLNQVLKRDWGYQGWVMSDWGAVHSLGAFVNGLDQQSGEQIDKQVYFDKPLKAGVAAGTIPQARVEDAARRVLRAMFANGLFDRPAATGQIDFAGHAAIAQQQAEEGIVLLMNKGILPLARTAKRIAVIGAHAEAGVPSGMGSSQVTAPYRTPTQFPARTVPIGGEGLMAMWSNVVFHPSPPLAAIRSRVDIIAAPAGGLYPSGSPGTSPDAPATSALAPPAPSRVTFNPGNYPSAAAEEARAADLAIVFVYQPSGEGDDMPDMTLPFGQDALIEAVAAANPNTIVVLQTGNPIRMPWADKVQAIVQSWYSGARGGEAIARVLFGEVNPSGRLPLTWPMDESQLPRPVIPGWGQPADSVARIDYTIEGSDIGYRWFARENKTPRYWFGHGLSYTSFAQSNFSVRGGRTVTASVDVTNSGKIAGKDVVQLYLTGRPGRPQRRLLAFQKIDLAPGETRRVTLTADPRLLASYDDQAKGWRIDGGDYEVGVGASAGDVSLRKTIRLSKSFAKP